MIEKHNFHWKEGFKYNFPQKRELFKKLAQEIKTRQIISITGLRRTGKSTLLKQLIDQLTESVPREHLLLYSFDEEQPKIEELFKEYEAKTGKNLKNKIYVFLDEIQKLKNWQNQIKYYYDNYENIKFFISGSSSLFIKKHTQESLAGRIYEFQLNPLSFREFLLFRNREELINKKQLLTEELKKEFSVYTKRQFIELINETEEKIEQYTRVMIEKIIYQDIPKIFPIGNTELLIKILKIIASNPGLLSDYESLSKEIGISRITLSNYFFYLEEAFLIQKIYNFSKNRITSEKKRKKFYLTATSFFPYLNESIDETKLIENLIVNAVKAQFFWRTPQKYEIDIILKENKEIIPIEIKYVNNITKKDIKNLIRFCKKYKINRAVLITKDTDKEEEITLKTGEKIKIILIPAFKFLLAPSTKYASTTEV